VTHDSFPAATDPRPDAVLLFPGQGAYDDGALRASRTSLLAARDIFEEIDDVAARLAPGSAGVTGTVLAENPPSLASLVETAPDRLQLAIFGLSTAVHRILTGAGLTAVAHAGHSFGEIAALVGAGAFTLAQGAEIVCHRNAVLRTLGDRPGAMAALGAPAARTAALLELLGAADIALAADNSPAQTVVSGTEEGLAAVQRVAAAVPLPAVRLQSPYGFHSALMRPLVPEFSARLRRLVPGPLRTPVYSPILGRWYQDGDDYAELLAAHLIRPVRFRDAVDVLNGHGGRMFVEAGARSALTGLVRANLPDATTVTTLDGPAAAGFPRAQLAAAGYEAPVPVPAPVPQPVGTPVDVLLPGADADAGRAFWAEHGAAVLADVRRRYDAFLAARTTTVLAPQPIPAPVPAPEPEANGSAGLSRDRVYAELTAFYATALEYPPEVFTEDVDLEADLGVDSVKQTELISRLADRYGLPERPENFRLADYGTLGRITDYVIAGRIRPDLAA
jgi:acyl transferase domain-containing protein